MRMRPGGSMNGCGTPLVVASLTVASDTTAPAAIVVGTTTPIRTGALDGRILSGRRIAPDSRAPTLRRRRGGRA